MKRISFLLTPLVLGLQMGPNFSASAATNEPLDALDAKIVQLSKPGTSVEDVLRVLGEPETYTWGDKTFKKNSLPETYILRYPKGTAVAVSGGYVTELRSDPPGPGFTWHGKLRLGSSLEEVLQTLGPPSEIVEGKPLKFAKNVLYKDIEGEKGRCYYSRPDQNIRLFFRNNKVSGLYVPLDS